VRPARHMQGLVGRLGKKMREEKKRIFFKIFFYKVLVYAY
jgi:hypothetical protein